MRNRRWHRVRVDNIAVLYKTVVDGVNQTGKYEVTVDVWQRFR